MLKCWPTWPACILHTLGKQNVAIPNTCTFCAVTTVLSNHFFQQNKLTITFNKMITSGKSHLSYPLCIVGSHCGVAEARLKNGVDSIQKLRLALAVCLPVWRDVFSTHIWTIEWWLWTKFDCQLVPVLRNYCCNVYLCVFQTLTGWASYTGWRCQHHFQSACGMSFSELHAVSAVTICQILFSIDKWYDNTIILWWSSLNAFHILLLPYSESAFRTFLPFCIHDHACIHNYTLHRHIVCGMWRSIL